MSGNAQSSNSATCISCWCDSFVSCLAGDRAERGEGEQRGSQRSSERADREAALPADPGGGAGQSAQTGELQHLCE